MARVSATSISVAYWRKADQARSSCFSASLRATALFRLTGLVLLSAAAFPVLSDATRYGMGALKHSLHRCWRVRLSFAAWLEFQAMPGNDLAGYLETGEHKEMRSKSEKDEAHDGEQIRGSSTHDRPAKVH